MSLRIKLPLFLLIGLVLAACTSTESSPSPEANMPNPASVYCEEHGGKVEIRTDAEGNQYGVCIFEDGSECDEWAYFRGECAPGGEAVEPANEPDVRISLADDGCQLYTNTRLGYSFHFPADANIIENDEPLKSFSIQGPLVNDEYWPVIYVAHPSDREDHLPPVDVNLEQWLEDHNLLAGEIRLEDTQIAGELAIHFRHNRSPQSYADDRYFFAHAGQLYSIVILHTADKEDWELYNHFLQSFDF